MFSIYFQSKIFILFFVALIEQIVIYEFEYQLNKMISFHTQ